MQPLRVLALGWGSGRARVEAFETEWRVELECGEGRVRRAVAAGAACWGPSGRSGCRFSLSPPVDCPTRHMHSGLGYFSFPLSPRSSAF